MTTRKAKDAQGSDEEPKRVERVLARPLIQAGVEHKPGETVSLWPHQAEWLGAEGYFEEAKR